MVEVLIERPTPRVEYALKLLFDYLLPCKWRAVPKYAASEKPDPDYPLRIAYLRVPPERTPFIPCDGWLYDGAFQPHYPELTAEKLPLLFPPEKAHKKALIQTDLPAAIFFLATQYPLYFEHPKDAHGRPVEDKVWTYKKQLDREPLCHLWAADFAYRMKKRYPRFKYQKRKPSLEFTVDIDHPWEFKNLPGTVKFGGMAKDFLTGKWGRGFKRLGVFFGGKDRYDTYGLMKEHLPPELTRFFFLTHRSSPHDNRHHLKMKAYRKLISGLAEEGYGTGIHPSYHSSESEALMQEELKTWLQHFPEALISRQHYLKYRVPDTFRQLEAAGIRREYSVATYSRPGFPTGMAIPFPWYDVEFDLETQLMIHPGMVMDRTLQLYLGLDPAGSIRQVKEIATQVKKVNGNFVLLLHNETLSDVGDWQGWRASWLEIFAWLKNEFPA